MIILLWVLIIYVLVALFYVLATFIRNYLDIIKSFKEIRAEQKACHSNCKIIMEAIEKYNNNHPSSNIQAISHNVGEDYKFEEMDSDNVKNISCLSERCHYLYDKKRSEVYCACHGSPSQPWNLYVVDPYPYSLPDDYIPSNEDLKKKFIEETINAEKSLIKELICNLPKNFLSALIAPISGCINYLLYLIIFKGRHF